MDISKAALPPIQPAIRDTDRAHPMFPKYQAYRGAMSMQLVEAQSFSAWLSCLLRDQRDAEIKSHPQFKDFQEWMWKTKGGTPGKTNLQWPDNFYAWQRGERW